MTGSVDDLLAMVAGLTGRPAPDPDAAPADGSFDSLELTEIGVALGDATSGRVDGLDVLLATSWRELWSRVADG